MSRNSRRKPQVQQLDDRSVPAAMVASVSGLVFSDTNASGVQEAGEPGLGSVPVLLRSGADGTTEAATLTAADGTFQFANVADGLHLVTVTPSAGTNSSDVVRAVSISGGQSVGPLAVGVKASGSVSGAAYVDVNANSRKDGGEAGVGGVTVTLDLFGSGKSPLSTTTAADGSYKFSGVPDGQHKISFSGSAAQGGNLNPVTVNVVGGAQATAIDGGLRPTSALSGTVTLGSSAAGSPGLPGITVSLDLNSDSKIDAVTTTDGNGNWLFAGVSAGTHAVTVNAPGASSFDTADKTNRVLVSTTGDVKAGVNVGVSFSGKVQGSTFIDPNGDGKYAAGDVTIIPAAVQVDLFNSGKLVSVPAQNPNTGSYFISNIPDGTHTLVVTPPGGYKATTATRLPITVTNGNTVTVADVGYRASGGATVAVGNGEQAGATVYTFTPGANGSLTATQGALTTPLGKAGAGTRAVTADVNGDGMDDLITGAGPGGSPIVRIYDGRTGTELVPNGIPVFESGFLGGLNLAAGDFLKTGRAQIVVSADVGGGPRVRVIDPSQYMTGADPTRSKVVADFFGIDDPDFRGGTRAAVGDLNGDGTPDLIVAAGAGGGPRVAVFDGRTVGGGADPVRMTSDFFAFEPGLRNGAVVSVGDINGNGLNDLIVGAGPGGSPRVTVFDGRGIVAGQADQTQRLADFFVNGDNTSRAGTRLTVKDLDADGKADIVATNGARAFVFTGQSILATYLTGETPVAATILNPFPQSARGGLFVG